MFSIINTFAVDILAKVDIHVLCQAQFQVGFGFPNPISAQRNCFSTFLLGDLILLLPLEYFLSMFDLCHKLCVHSCTSGCIAYEHGGYDPLSQLSQIPFSPWPCPIRVFQANAWQGQSLLSWSLGLWTCCLSHFLLSGPWTLQSNSHCTKSCATFTSLTSSSLSIDWGPADHLSSWAPQSPVLGNCHQSTQKISWIPCDLLCWLFKRYRGSKSNLQD